MISKLLFLGRMRFAGGRIVLLFLIVFLGVSTAGLAGAAIEYEGEQFSAELGSENIAPDSLIEEGRGVASEISLEQSAQTVGFIKGIWLAIGRGFSATNLWLSEKAGINLLGILKTIGSWFVILLEWVLRLIKWLLGRV